MTMIFQEMLVLLVVAGALLYLSHRLLGWPRRRRPEPGPPVQLGSRLQRGLAARAKAPTKSHP